MCRCCKKINESEIKEVVITNTVPITSKNITDKIKIISIATLFGETIKRTNEHKPIENLFYNAE